MIGTNGMWLVSVMSVVCFWRVDCSGRAAPLVGEIMWTTKNPEQIRDTELTRSKPYLRLEMRIRHVFWWYPRRPQSNRQSVCSSFRSYWRFYPEEIGPFSPLMIVDPCFVIMLSSCSCVQTPPNQFPDQWCGRKHVFHIYVPPHHHHHQLVQNVFDDISLESVVGWLGWSW